jgi:hypothetical protein
MRIGDIKPSDLTPSGYPDETYKKKMEEILKDAKLPVVERKTMVSVAHLERNPNPITFPSGNTFLALLPPDFKKAMVGVPADKQYVLVGAVDDALIFAEWPHPICEAFRLIPMRPGVELTETKA